MYSSLIRVCYTQSWTQSDWAKQVPTTETQKTYPSSSVSWTLVWSISCRRTRMAWGSTLYLVCYFPFYVACILAALVNGHVLQSARVNVIKFSWRIRIMAYKASSEEYLFSLHSDKYLDCFMLSCNYVGFQASWTRWNWQISRRSFFHRP